MAGETGRANQRAVRKKKKEKIAFESARKVTHSIQEKARFLAGPIFWVLVRRAGNDSVWPRFRARTLGGTHICNYLRQKGVDATRPPGMPLS